MPLNPIEKAEAYQKRKRENTFFNNQNVHQNTHRNDSAWEREHSRKIKFELLHSRIDYAKHMPFLRDS